MDMADLSQGDILKPTEDLSKVFAEVHPHFNDPKYLAFLITTQSCDLVRRNGRECSARFINVVVVRLLEHVLLWLLDSVCEKVILGGVYTDDSKARAENLIRKIINQNEQALGLFYLHPDAHIGINEPAVALLRVGVTFRVDHYETIRRARIGSLNKEFESKLGWLVGNLYSRVGTQDWTDSSERVVSQNQLVQMILHTKDSDSRPIWIPKKAAKAAEKAGVRLANLNRDTIVEAVEKHRPTPRVDEAAEIAAKVMEELVPGTDQNVLRKFAMRLRNHAAFSSMLR
jgi:hypothetical protein